MIRLDRPATARMQIPHFIRRHVNPADRMAEMIFGLVMALGVTGAIRLGATDLDSRELFVSVVGCNIAWGIVDGVVLVLMRLFERGRVARVVRRARSAANDDQAYQIIEDELAPDVVDLMTQDERSDLRAIVLGMLPRVQPKPARMERGDLLHGISAGLLVMLPTIPVVLPYLLFDDTFFAVRVSSVVALILLFLIGHRWGRMVGAQGWKIGGALVLLGAVLVVITVALGG
jgi:VIT1/CCC1 family predicted Fe2+/Mn2+ transporter